MERASCSATARKCCRHARAILSKSGVLKNLVKRRGTFDVNSFSTFALAACNIAAHSLHSNKRPLSAQSDTVHCNRTKQHAACSGPERDSQPLDGQKCCINTQTTADVGEGCIRGDARAHGV